jgi:hypothetical protein
MVNGRYLCTAISSAPAAFFSIPPDVGAHSARTAVDSIAERIGRRSLRREAGKALGSPFDLRRFRGVVLDDGVVTLPILADNVHRWIASRAHTP